MADTPRKPVPGLIRLADTELLEAVTILPSRHAWHVTPDGNGGYAERAIIPRLIIAGQD
jgi:hypothetical protein